MKKVKLQWICLIATGYVGTRKTEGSADWPITFALENSEQIYMERATRKDINAAACAARSI